MSRKAPFPKTPQSQYRKPEFYWRGGDKYREQEYVTDEYKKALADYRIAEQELRVVKEEVAAASETLNERDGYTSALAGFMDDDADGYQTEVELKQELARLEREIHEHEEELQRRQAVHNPAVAGGLQKEKAYYLIEIQRGAKAIDNAYEESVHAREQLAACAVNNRYRNALQLEFQLDKVARKKRFLRSLVNKTKYTFDTRRPVAAVQTNDARTQRIVLQNGIDLKMSLARAEEKKERRRAKHANQINFLICQIEELNIRMSDIGMESDVVDTEPLRSKYLGTGGGNDGEKPNEGEGQEHHTDTEVRELSHSDQKPQTDTEQKHDSVSDKPPSDKPHDSEKPPSDKSHDSEKSHSEKSHDSEKSHSEKSHDSDKPHDSEKPKDGDEAEKQGSESEKMNSHSSKHKSGSGRRRSGSSRHGSRHGSDSGKKTDSDVKKTEDEDEKKTPSQPNSSARQDTA